MVTSPKLSKFLPPMGTRAMLTIGPSITLVPFILCSTAIPFPNVYMAVVFLQPLDSDPPSSMMIRYHTVAFTTCITVTLTTHFPIITIGGTRLL